MECRDPSGFRAAWAHCSVVSLPSGCPELAEAVAVHGARCADLPLFPDLAGSPPIAAYACPADSIRPWCTDAGYATSTGATRAAVAAAPWDKKRVVPIAATSALVAAQVALYGDQVRRTKNKRLVDHTGEPPGATVPLDMFTAIEEVGLGQDAGTYDAAAQAQARERGRAQTGYKPRDLLLGL